MEEVECIEYRETGFFSKLICDYVEQKESLKEFYNHFPSLTNFKSQIEEKSNFSEQNRKILVESLQTQYKRLNNPTVSTDTSEFNISLLSDKSTYTITTGHQLNIFTGPLYFIYKIVSTVNLCKQLKAAYPEHNFVPIYWMATEDHDFAEINHINVSGGRTSWDIEASGPVGRLATDSFTTVLSELKEVLGEGTKAEELESLFKRSYLRHSNLADATRYMVHELLGDTGLVILDADDANLKRLVIPYFWEDLKNNLPAKATKASSKRLEEDYFEQVHIRDINLFYIKDGLRERIEKKADKWAVLNTTISWTEEELKAELEARPECFSPNVVMRPLYQEVILPNLAYIGGGGELAYWFQLQEMFNQFKLPFPMLILRNSALWMNQNQKEQISKLGFTVKDVFSPLEELTKLYAKRKAPMDTELLDYEQRIEQIFDELEEVAQLTDKSMLGAVNAQRYKQLNGLQNLKKKLINAEKKRNHIEVDKIKSLYLSLFPNSSLQERHDNFTTLYLEYGKDFLEMLFKSLEPVDFSFRVITA